MAHRAIRRPSPIWIYVHGGQPVLYASSGPTGGVSAYRLEAGGPQLLDRDPFQPGGAQAVPGELEQIALGGDTVLVALGRHEPSPQCFTLDAGGRLVAAGEVVAAGGYPGTVVAMESARVGGKDFVFSCYWGSGEIGVYEAGPDGMLTERARTDGGPGVQGDDIAGLEALRVGGADFLITASSSGDNVKSYAIAPDGTLSERAALGIEDGLAVDAPTAMVPVELLGSQYLVLGSAGTQSLSVIEVAATGSLTVVDHVLDGRDTRFGEVQAVDAVMLGDQAFVVAGAATTGCRCSRSCRAGGCCTAR